MTEQREAKVQKYFKTMVSKLGGTTRKWVSPGHDGVPDQIMFHKGEIWFVEIKTDDGALTPVQQREHERLRACGANVITLFGNKGIENFFSFWGLRHEHAKQEAQGADPRTRATRERRNRQVIKRDIEP
jgi:hypothetical protein